MINLKKHDPVADVIRGIMEKELVGNQKKLDKNHNGKLDKQDFEILRGQKKATEDVEQIDELKKSTLASYAKKAGDESSYYSFAAGSRSAKDPQRLVSDKLAMKRQSGVNKAIDRLAKEDVEQQDEAMSHQAKTTMKHIPNPSPALKKAAKDIKPGVAGYRDRVAMLKAGGVKEEAEKTEDTLVGRVKTNKKDDVGPGSDFKSSKVKLKAEEAELEENAFDYKSPRQPEPNGGSGVKKGTRYGGSKQKDDTPKGPNYEDLESGKTNWKKENDLVKTLKHGYKKEEVESLEEKNWIAGAIKHPGAETAAAKKAGMSVQAYASKHQHDSGTAGKRARLAMTLKKMKENYEEPILDEMINEVLSKDASAYDYIHDFVHSDNPKFAGKSKAERKKQALAAYYAKKNEEYVEEGMLKNAAKKAFKALTGGSDEDQRKDLQRKMGVPQTGKKPEPKNEEVVMEGRSPVSSQGMDTPFVTDAENKPLANAKELAAKTMKRMKNEMLGKAGTSE
jgi:hypothetical protein